MYEMIFNLPIESSIEVEENGTVVFYFYRADGAICASAGLSPGGTAFAHVYDGTKILERESMTAEEISEAALLAASEP